MTREKTITRKEPRDTKDTFLCQNEKTYYHHGNTTYIVYSKFLGQGKNIIDILKQLLCSECADMATHETH